MDAQYHRRFLVNPDQTLKLSNTDIKADVAPQHCFVIGIGGGTGSGKSCLSGFLLRRYADSGVTLIDQDSYYIDRGQLSSEARQHLNYDHPSTIDHDLVLRHITDLTRGSSVEKPCYCFETHARTKTTFKVRPAPLVIVEGIFALWDDRLRTLMDLKIYVDAEADLRFIRRLRRDVLDRGRTAESVITQYLDSVRPMHEVYIAPTRSYADVILDNNWSVDEFASAAEELTLKITLAFANSDASISPVSVAR